MTSLTPGGSPPPPLRIAIVGGGIAGLCAAHGIIKAQKEGANVQLDIYEAAHQFAEIGAGVAFGPNAQRALRLLGLGDALQAITAGTDKDDPDTWFDVHVGQEGPEEGEFITKITGHDAALGSVHRADFLNQLIDRLPKELAHFHHRCTSYTPHENGVTLHFEPKDDPAAGSSNSSAAAPTAEADVILASDGIKSLLRGHMYERKRLPREAQEARYSEWVAWRGLIPIEKFREACGEEVNTKLMFYGLDKHILTFPIKSGKVINIVAFVRDPEHKKLGDHKGPWSESRPKSELAEDFASFSQTCKSLLDAIDDPSIWGIFELPEIEIAVDERVVLIGDSAHATTPHQGAGAGQAVEDALFLTSFLCSPVVYNSEPETRLASIQKALDKYSEVRHSRGVKVQKTSHEAGLLYEFRGPEVDDLDLIRKSLSERMAWIWSYDTEGELKKALESLSG